MENGYDILLFFIVPNIGFEVSFRTAQIPET